MAAAPTLDLAGRTALVTGAASGIGRAVAETFAALGADLALCDRDGEGLAAVGDRVAATGRGCTTGVLDVRDHDAVAAFVDRAADERGALHVVVNNVGGTFAAPFADSRPRGDEALVRENLLSAAWVTRAALPHLTAPAAVVNVTTIEARRAAPDFALYAAAKAGLENLTMTLALELADRGVRVNAVAPDVVVTPGVGDLRDATSPLGRVGRPDEVAAVVAFLACDLASFVTGAVVPVDGGNRAAGGWRRSPSGGWST